MIEGNGGTPEEKLVFAAELFPHRSLGRKGFTVLLVTAALVCFSYGALFVLRGAWPIGLFLGFDFLLLSGAFWLNYRAGRVREEVRVSRTDVSIRKVLPSGRAIEHRFNPFRLRFLVRREPGIGIRSMHVSGEGRQADVGAFLNPEDRESFAKAFRAALSTVTRRI
ncbi:DUF2244 domain-containing protein [Rhizobium sp. HT1-10]|uniref:DUF2244 domain-containing protein n=1 Tax=Rhizobium sp. HT1-10 TaxID=3111638 RepID=UPI003C2A6F0C